MQSTVETAHAEHMQWRQRMRSTCDGDSACGAHAMETEHAVHGGDIARWIKHMLSTVETAHAEHSGDSAC